MKSEKLKFTLLISILIFAIIFPITLNIMINTNREERQKSIINIPKLSAETEWVPNGTLIYDDAWSQGYPQICSDGSGGAIIVWFDYRFATDNIYAQRIDSNGNLLWDPNGTAIRTESVLIYYDSLEISSDGYGGAIVIWEEYVDAVEQYNVYAQKINANGIAQWTPNGTAVCTEIGNQLNPHVCNDGMGGAIIAWEDERSGIDSDIYAQRINATGDIKWTGNGTAICTGVGDENFNQIISDNEGGMIIAWTNSDIYAQKINATGVYQWDANGRVICSDGNLQGNPRLCSDEYGDIIITWEDFRYGDADIFSQKIDSNGIAQWTPDGIEVSVQETYHDKKGPHICSDGSGGAFITWMDQPAGGSQYWDIFAQRVNSSGAPNWEYDTIICEANGNQRRPRICSDGSEGAIITWQDGRAVSTDIYAQKIQADGSIQWGWNGRAICNLTTQETFPQLCSDGLGGAIITWTANGIYALRIDNLPYSNRPDDFETYSDGSEIINWTLFDDTTGGKYRVITNDTDGHFYVWVDWTSWDHNVPLNIPINRTELGFFSYKIEYYDELNQIGIPDIVIVLIKAHPSEEVIPLGHYYLLFIILSVALIIIVKKFHIKQKS